MPSFYDDHEDFILDPQGPEMEPFIISYELREPEEYFQYDLPNPQARKRSFLDRIPRFNRSSSNVEERHSLPFEHLSTEDQAALIELNDKIISSLMQALLGPSASVGYDVPSIFGGLGDSLSSSDFTLNPWGRYIEHEDFPTPESQTELFNFSFALAQYIHDKNVAATVFIDRSARTARLGVKEVWNHYYGDEKMPPAFFLNPKGFRSEQATSRTDVLSDNLKASIGLDKVETSLDLRLQDEIEEEFQEIYHRLFDHKDRPVLVIDTCIHSGKTLQPVIATMRKLGFKDVRLAAVTDDRKWMARTRADLVLMKDGEPDKQCVPFGCDFTTQKSYGSCEVERQPGRVYRDDATRLRSSIVKIIHDQIAQRTIPNPDQEI